MAGCFPHPHISIAMTTALAQIKSPDNQVKCKKDIKKLREIIE